MKIVFNDYLTVFDYPLDRSEYSEDYFIFDERDNDIIYFNDGKTACVSAFVINTNDEICHHLDTEKKRIGVIVI